MTTQPEALRLAEFCDGNVLYQPAAAELRRLHEAVGFDAVIRIGLFKESQRLQALNEELLEALKLALTALDCDVHTAPISPVSARAAQAWMRSKFGDAARAAIKKAEG